MRSRLPVLLALVVLAGACATRSDRSTALPDIPVGLVVGGPEDVGTGVCTLTFGGGRGAYVEEVLPGSPAEGSVAGGDVIVAFDGDPILTSADLVEAVRASAPGDAVVIAGERGGGAFEATVTLAESPEVSGRPMLGVIVSTVENQVAPDDVAPDALTTPLTRVVAVGGALWLLDPTGIAWSPLDATAPPGGTFLPVDGEVYTVESRPAGTAIVGALSGEAAIVDLQGWEPTSVIGTLGAYLLLGTERVTGEAETEYAVVAVDPVASTPKWAWITDPASEFPVPLIGHRSPDGTRSLLALGAPGSTQPGLWVLLTEEAGQPVADVAAGFPGAATALGWHDDSRVLVVGSAIDQVVVVDPVNGTSVASTLPITDPPTGLWPVGDGAHVLVGGSNGLVLARVGGPDRRVLTDSCGAATVTDLGWIAG